MVINQILIVSFKVVALIIIVSFSGAVNAVDLRGEWEGGSSCTWFTITRINLDGAEATL